MVVALVVTASIGMTAAGVVRFLHDPQAEDGGAPAWPPAKALVAVKGRTVGAESRRSLSRPRRRNTNRRQNAGSAADAGPSAPAAEDRARVQPQKLVPPKPPHILTARAAPGGEPPRGVWRNASAGPAAGPRRRARSTSWSWPA